MQEPTELEKRQSIIDHCRKMNSSGLNQGVSGNISIRHGDGMLISPTSVPYDALTPEAIAFVRLGDGAASGPFAPSSEWRFHRDIIARRRDVNAVVHAHPNFCTVLGAMGYEIPAMSYMINIFGGPNIRIAPYALYGTQELSDVAIAAMKGRHGVLLANHGMIAVGSSVEQAFWRAEEMETLARLYHGCLQIGTPVPLSEAQVQEVIDKNAAYGLGTPEDEE
ncbi:Ribulose-5-phosphate 4-epimerase [Candidatus Rhodobacter oscarellae]|uniref:Ribulose-5-phosphate 4-epimerase n=1 Tax=Candidatus Rhodobacter oscarellae TaxID=1675527 RepID=A0A0J9E7X7_9RHOB|nr:class II aldolase/adducin family protein [Candidatus Rhodobacter lobularis]KMW58836.1 Ribulose-5-phosphate 4-epimerase [Candidatus Rhodobacter lobularis]